MRGLSSELKGAVSALYATAFAEFLKDAKLAEPGSRIAVAQDFRESSPEIAATVMAALKRAGLEPVDCGAIPTPALAFYAMGHGWASIMITGSHIPADRNGIKFYRPDGEIGKTDEAAITGFAETLAKDETANRVEQVKGDNHETEAVALFLKRNRAVLPAGALSGLRIGVYQHSTVARDMMIEVLKTYYADAVPLGRSDTFIPVDTEAVSIDTLEKIARWSADEKLDAIISADGDGDRPLVADENGVPLRGDLLGLITARFLKAKCVATPVTSNSGIESAGDFTVERTRVGSPYVIAAMDDAMAEGKTEVMGFEANGGLMLGTDFEVDGRRIAALPTRDSFVPVLSVLYLAAQRKVPVSQIAADFSLPVAAADRLENYPTEKSQALMQYLRASPDNMEAFLAPIGRVAQTSDIDGLRVTLEDGRIIHVRPSGNAPELRCYVEAKTEDAAEALLAQGLSLLSAWEPA
ncbi:phosphomannomutase [Rhizobium halophytocola]|uniref:Phosphomannomutase n=1 Tax=Rhizobium halophytocola TaxID=735519 RepID=A0ABS4E139_9HYPH|nr:phosphomannomutase [Rhizobium halophytocola]